MNYNKAEFVTSFGKFEQIPPSDRPEFAFSGRSNVGKSSLINKIFNRKNLARVSSVPGKTVTINFKMFILLICRDTDMPMFQNRKKQSGAILSEDISVTAREILNLCCSLLICVMHQVKTIFK